MICYTEQVLPRLLHVSVRHETLEPYRRRVVTHAIGRVLEIGIGSGRNLPYYDATTDVIGLDPSKKLLSRAHAAAWQIGRSVELVEAAAEAIPLPDRFVDTVVSTWSLCSISDVGRALCEMRRVLKPTGRLLFVEPGRSPDDRVGRWQDRLAPVWKRIGGGCHLNRRIEQLIRDAGFKIVLLETGYMKGAKPVMFVYQGIARRT